MVGDVEVSRGRYNKARDFLRKNRNRQLKLTESNIEFFILLLSETKDLNSFIKRYQEGKLEKEDRHIELQIEKGLRSLAVNQEMNFSDEFIEKRINKLFLEESKMPRIYRDVMSKVGNLTETVEGYAFRYAHAKGKYRDNLDKIIDLLQDCENEIDMMDWLDN